MKYLPCIPGSYSLQIAFNETKLYKKYILASPIITQSTNVQISSNLNIQISYISLFSPNTFNFEIYL